MDRGFILAARVQVSRANRHVNRTAAFLVEQDVLAESLDPEVRPERESAESADAFFEDSQALQDEVDALVKEGP